MSVEQSVAADGPMAAAVLAALDVPALLLTNDLGADLDGIAVERWLRRCGVNAIARARQGGVTPRIVVVADKQGTRTWFPYLPGVADSLARLDLSPAGLRLVCLHRLLLAHQGGGAPYDQGCSGGAGAGGSQPRGFARLPGSGRCCSRPSSPDHPEQYR
jgi:sugar/nucleoside kinase (ribokinase family)